MSTPDESSNAERRQLRCPSAAPGEGAVLFAVRTGADTRPGVRYLNDPVLVTPEILALAEPVDPREVFRMALPCAESACAHFAQSRCSLATRIAEQLPEVVDRLPACRIRSTCRWFAQEGEAACLRCPAVLTLQNQPTPAMAAAALAGPRDSDDLDSDHDE